MLRAARTVVVLVVGALTACVGVPGSSDGFVSVRDARADVPAITVGTALLAVSDVTVKRAAIRKGSRVTVTGVRDSHGRTLVDLELADGHVLRRVMMSSILASFRVVA